MSDTLGKVGGPTVANTTGIDTQNNTDEKNTVGNLGPTVKPAPADKDTILSFEGAKVIKHSAVPENYKSVIETIRQPKPSNTFLHKLGRAVLWFVNLFKGVKSSSTLSTDEKLNILRNKQPSPLPDNVKNKGAPYSFNTDMLANLSGLDKGKGIRYEPFYNMDKEPNKDYKDVLFPSGEPRLADIKQNPELQDCWFLSSITSLLQTQGTESITRLFSPSDIPGNVVVRLGTNLYDVPMARIADGNGDKFGSDSAPWVVVLENAMLMHLSLTANEPQSLTHDVLESYKEDIRMPLRYPSVGFAALLGSSTSGGENATVVHLGRAFNSVEEGRDIISKLLKKGKPVVIGQLSGSSPKIALRDGISPGHAVTVLEVIPNGFKVLDPYGQVKTLPQSSIIDYSFSSVRGIDENSEDYSFVGIKDPDENNVPEEYNPGGNDF